MLSQAIHTYPLREWAAYFFIYCFAGWIWETLYCSLKARKFQNRGFMFGPWIPLYGSGALVMLLVALPVSDRPWLVFVAGGLSATALEFVVGAAMEAIFKVRYWDYSDVRGNLCGYVCLPASLLWGGFTLLLVYVVHEPMARLVESVPQITLSLLDVLAGACFAADFTVSLKAAVDLRRVLTSMEKLRSELEDVRRQIEQRAAERLESSPAHESLERLRERSEELRTQLERRRSERAPWRDRLVRRHGGLRSSSFPEALEKLREAAARRFEDDK